MRRFSHRLKYFSLRIRKISIGAILNAFVLKHVFVFTNILIPVLFFSGTAGAEELVLWNDKDPLSVDLKIGRFGAGQKYFNSPLDLALQRGERLNADTIFILDSGNSRIQKIDSDGKYISQIRLFLADGNKIEKPVAIALSTEDGSLYVLSSEMGKVFKYDSSGAFVLSFGKSGLGNGAIDDAVDLTVDRSGYIYVLDQGRKKVLRWHKNGTFVGEWGKTSDRPDGFETPVSIAYNDELIGSLCVLDVGKQAIISFHADGQFLDSRELTAFAREGYDKFAKVDVAPTGDIFILEGPSSKLIFLSKRITSIYSLATEGYKAQKLGGLVVDEHGRVYVSDLGGNRILRFKLDIN